MSRPTQFASRNSAKLKVLRYLSNADGHVSAIRLMPLFSIRSYRNTYNVMARLTKWELVSRRTGTLGLLEFSITKKGRERLAYYQRKEMAA